MPLNDIVEQDAAKERLHTFWEGGRLPGSLLLHGPVGVGKTRLALTYARALNCEVGDGDACDACASCRKALKFAHPDIRFVFPMPHGKSASDDEQQEARILEQLAKDPWTIIQFDRNASIWIEKVRTMRRQSAMATAEGRVKVFVVRDADRMAENLAGALLKILEEPPRDTHFILTTSRLQALLPTIVSRCQAVSMTPLSRTAIAGVLTGRFQVEAADARLCAALAQGSLGRALLMAGEDVRALRDQAVALLAAAEQGGRAMFAAADGLARERDRTLMRRLAHALAVWHGDLLAVRYGLDEERIANLDRLADLRDQAARIGVDEIRRRLTVFEEMREAQDRNVGYAIAAYWLVAALNDPAATTEPLLGELVR